MHMVKLSAKSMRKGQTFGGAGQLNIHMEKNELQP
jgi:hypothetical protein